MNPEPDLAPQILDELDRVLRSPEFASAGKVGPFLRFAVERTLAGDREALKESVIGSHVFGRAPGYDPKVDPIVRTEARRLRARLDEYAARVQPSVRITLPKGGYVTAFEIRPVAPPAPAVPVPEPPSPPASNPAWRHPVTALAAAAVLALAALAFYYVPKTGTRSPLPVLTTITSYPGFQFHPSLSPDGNQVAFIWTGENGGPANLFVAPLNGGEPRRLTTGGRGEASPVWSPDGSRIAFVRRGKGLIIIPAGGGEERILVDSAYASQLDWSPDGRSLAFADFPPGSDQPALFLADSLTGTRRLLPNTSRGLYPAFSPDAALLAFARCDIGNCELYVMPATGGEPRQVTRQRSTILGVTWNPAGQEIVFASRRLGASTLWRVPATGSGTPELMPSAGEEARYPRFGAKRSASPRLVYEQGISDSNIWRQSLELGKDGPLKFTGEPHRLIASTRVDSSPQVSPDGRHIAFISTRSGFEELWTVDINGGHAVQVTQMRAQAMGSPRWSPDSSRLSFDAVSPEGRSLYIVDAAGGHPRQWTAPNVAGRSSWSHDGRWLYLAQFDSKHVAQLERISTTDQAQRSILTSDGGFESFESEDASTLFYIRDRELRRMPRDGGPSTAVLPGTLIAHGWWGLAPGGIAYVDLWDPALYSVPPVSKGKKKVTYLDLKTGQRRQLGTIAGDLIGVFPDFCIAPGGRQIYYSVLEVSVSQIRLIEGF
ncbi:hypothetical protein [Paludibaculum fermentans]|uniref:hypothetical protein n=1 Tax=Paludibaculum fermentans TaxID=1473598 RepID=UPI003EB96D20